MSIKKKIFSAIVSAALAANMAATLPAMTTFAEEEIIQDTGTLGEYVLWYLNDFAVCITDYHLEYRIDLNKNECVISCINENTTINQYNSSFDYDVSNDEIETFNNAGASLDLSDKFNLIFADGIEIINSTILNEKYIESMVLNSSCTEVGRQVFYNLTELSEVVIYSTCVDLNKSGLGFLTDDNGNEAINLELVIKGYSGSTAETYANANGFTFIALDEETDITINTETTTTETKEVPVVTEVSTTTTETSAETTTTTVTTNSDTTSATAVSETTPKETESSATTAGTASSTETAASATDTEPIVTATTEVPVSTETETALPQTGYSKWYQLLIAAAVGMIGIGGTMVIGSGVMKKKRR